MPVPKPNRESLKLWLCTEPCSPGARECVHSLWVGGSKLFFSCFLELQETTLGSCISHLRQPFKATGVPLNKLVSWWADLISGNNLSPRKLWLLVCVIPAAVECKPQTLCTKDFSRALLPFLNYKVNRPVISGVLSWISQDSKTQIAQSSLSAHTPFNSYSWLAGSLACAGALSRKDWSLPCHCHFSRRLLLRIIQVTQNFMLWWLNEPSRPPSHNVSTRDVQIPPLS